MMKKTFLFFLMLFMGLHATGLQASPKDCQTLLANPGFEEDIANVGNPDGWQLGKNAQVEVQNNRGSEGSRALFIQDGYAVVQQNLQVDSLAGLELQLKLDAEAASPGAVFGVRIGFFTQNNQWQDLPLFWNKALSNSYQSYTAKRLLPADAKAGRLWLAIYRSDGKGAFLLDNVCLTIGARLPEEVARRVVALKRDTSYFLNRLSKSVKLLSGDQQAAWRIEGQTILQKAEAQQAALLSNLQSQEQRIVALNADLFARLSKGEKIFLNWAQPYEPLAPDALPAVSTSSTFKPKILALRGEHRAFGLDIGNTRKEEQEVAIKVQGLPPQCRILWRRQIFTENWYGKGKSLIADPLTQLATQDGQAMLKLAPGEMARLLADITVEQDAPAGTYLLMLSFLEAGKIIKTRALTLQISPKPAPTSGMAHYEFGYIAGSPISNSTAEAVQDLVDHGVTDIEWAFMPKSVFDELGNLLRANYTLYDRLAKAFASSSIRLNVFWQPHYAVFKTEKGDALPILSEPWKNAFKQSFNAWLQRAAEHGISADRMTVLIKDEIHSKSQANAPDEKIEEYVEISKFFKAEFPQIKNYLTLTFYAYPADVKAVLPYVDVMLPHLPQPPKLLRNAPNPNYNPRTAFSEEIYPMLGSRPYLQLWSYHVASGRSGDLAAPWSRAYPLMAAATGHTGIAYWAYNAFNGRSTWDDTDGKLLDYNFVYDGKENHPLNLQWNVAKEAIVPSLRWEATRAGLQDAKIIIQLQNLLKGARIPSTQRARINRVLQQVQKLQGPGYTIPPETSYAFLESLSTQLRTAFNSIESTE
ncbi:MAG: hypothetical protein WAT67_01780 [Candidatus Contendobacter sp.]